MRRLEPVQAAVVVRVRHLRDEVLARLRRPARHCKRRRDRRDHPTVVVGREPPRADEGVDVMEDPGIVVISCNGRGDEQRGQDGRGRGSGVHFGTMPAMSLVDYAVLFRVLGLSTSLYFPLELASEN